MPQDQTQSKKMCQQKPGLMGSGQSPLSGDDGQFFPLGFMMLDSHKLDKDSRFCSKVLPMVLVQKPGSPKRIITIQAK